MKPIYCIVLVLLIGQAYSQKISVSENEEPYAQRTRSSFATTIYDNSLKEVKKELMLFLEQHKCEQTHENGAELYAHNVFLKNVLNKPVDVYYKLTEHAEEKHITLYAAVDIGASNYLSSEKYPAESREFVITLKEFSYRISRAPAEGYMKAAKDHQIKLTAELQQFEKEKSKLAEKLNSAREKEETLEKAYKETGKQIEEQKPKVIAIQNTLEPDTVKTKSAQEKRKLSELETDKLNTLLKKQDKQYAEWQKAKGKRTETELELSKNADMITDHNKEILRQKELEEKWKKRLEEIRME